MVAGPNSYNKTKQKQQQKKTKKQKTKKKQFHNSTIYLQQFYFLKIYFLLWAWYCTNTNVSMFFMVELWILTAQRVTLEAIEVHGIPAAIAVQKP